MTIDGDVQAGWEPVADVFRQSFEDGLEVGAAFAVYQDGRPVVDLWGGFADLRTKREWKRETAACVFSTTKGITAICAHLLVQRGELDLDAPVSAYWPEFAGGGKADLPVRWLLTHQAGLTFVDRDLTFEDVRDVAPVLRALGAQVPLWEPGTAYGYHAVTFGFLVGEVVRRISGKTLGRFLADELAAPLGLQARLGLPIDEDIDLAVLEPSPDVVDPLAGLSADLRAVAARFEREITLGIARFQRAITLGGAWPAKLVTGEPGDFNDRRVLAVELGGSNLVTNARSLARAYAATVSEVDGVRILTDATAAECYPMRTTECAPYGIPAELADAGPRSDFGLGFMAGEKLGPTSFGHPGAGGSLAFADLEHRLAFAYVPNLMRGDGDERAKALVDAVRERVTH